MANVNIVDPSQVGISGLRGLNRLSGAEREYEDLGLSNSIPEFKLRRAAAPTEAPSLDVGVAGVGDSRYDSDITSLTQLNDLNETRAELLPWYDLIGAGITKGVVLAGTTFADGVVGTVVGLTNMMATGEFSKFWDNPFSKAMQLISEYSEQAIPNYYSKAELEDPWYEHAFSSNFIGDKFLKNIGFTVGAYYSGKVFTSVIAGDMKGTAGAAKAIGAGELTKDAVKAPPMVQAVTGALLSSVNEGKIEAINNTKSWAELQTLLLTDKYQLLLADIEVLYGDTELGLLMAVLAEEAYNSTLVKILEDRAKMGNADFLLNLPILMVSNMVEFANLYSGGYKTARKLTNIAKKNGKYVSSATKLGILKATAKTALAEGSEEVELLLASDIPGNYYQLDVDNFYKSKLDPLAEKQTINLIKTIGSTIALTLGNGDTWELFAIGGLTGALGMPVFRSSKTAEGKWLSPVTIEGGIKGELHQYNEDKLREQMLSDYLNTRLESPEFVNYYQGLIRHNKYQNDMDMAVEDASEFDYKNASHSQLVGDVVMFDNAGKLNDLRLMLEDAYSPTDDNILSIVLNTTDEHGNSPYKDLTKELVILKLTKDKDKIFKTIDNYVKVKDALDIKFGDRLDDELLEEVTWLVTLDENWKLRGLDMFKDIQKVLTSAADYLETTLKDDPQLKEKIDNIRKLATMNPETFISIINSNPEENKEFLSVLSDFTLLSDNGLLNIDMVLKTEDLTKLIEARKEASKKITEYLTNPLKILLDLDTQLQLAIQDQLSTDADIIKSKLDKALNIQDVKTAVSESPNAELAKLLVNKAVDLGNSIAKNYRDVQSYTDTINSFLNDSKYSPEAKARATLIYDEMYLNAEGLLDVANPDNEVITLAILNGENDSVMALLEAINKANNDLKFRDNFSGPYKELKQINKPVIDKSTTKLIASPLKAIGDITEDLIKEENKILQNSEESPETKDTGSRLYLRPSIPELHIGASKAGDFRPFNVVVQEREKGVNFDAIYNYLYNKGAFEFINKGNLKVGDDVLFMIDPTMTDPITQDPFIFLSTKDGLIIGSLDSGDISTSRYKGLLSLRKTLLELYNKTDKSSVFISDLSTKVAKIMPGKLQYSEDSKSLNIVLGNETPMLGFVKNGTVFTNEVIPDALIAKPLDIRDKEGRLYLLSKRPDGKYGVSTVRVAHYNKLELTDQIKNSRFFANMLKIIKQLADTTDNGKVAELKAELGKYLYLDNTRFDYFLGDTGTGLRITVPKMDAEGNEIYTVDASGLRIREEVSTPIYFDLKSPTLGVLGEEGFIPLKSELVDTSDIATLINDTLMDLNMPFLVYGKNLNKTLGAIKWNDLLSESGILSTNLVSPDYKGSWFVTDYYDVEIGKFTLATPPSTVGIIESSDINPVIGGLNTAIGGTLIGDYYILSNGDILDGNGQKVTPEDAEYLKDKAYILNNYGNKMNGALMKDGIVLLPSGKVYNRNTDSYASNTEALKLKEFLAKGLSALDKALLVLGRLRDDQLRVDKERTDSEYYYIKEDDNEYHQYERVHSIIGNNWKESEDITQIAEDIQSKLLKLSTGKLSEYNAYIQGLLKKFTVDLSTYIDKTDSKSRNLIINTIKDSVNNTLSVRALKAGSAIDEIMRVFFEGGTTVRPDNISEAAYKLLLSSLSTIKQTMESNGNGEKFYTNNIVLFHNYNGKRVAGEVDILSVDNDGVFRIYDVKTSKYSFYPFTKNGQTYDYFNNASDKLNRSLEALYTLLLSAYLNLFESLYGSPIGGLAILPFVLEYSANEVKSIVKEKGIPITYSPSIEIPLKGEIAIPIGNTNSLIPIFNTLLNITDPTELLSDYNRLKDSKVGYYIKDNKIVKNYIKHIGNVGGIDIYISKVAKEVTDFKGNPAGEGSAVFDVIFPNGNSKTMYKDPASTAGKEGAIIKLILELISKVPDRIKELASIDTEISKASSKVELSNKLIEKITPSTITASKKGGALDAVTALTTALTPGLKRRPLDLKNRKKVTTPLSPTIVSISTKPSISQNELQGLKGSITFASLSAEIKLNLTKLGWTEENFNSITKEELEHALKCATL